MQVKILCWFGDTSPALAKERRPLWLPAVGKGPRPVTVKDRI